MRRRRLLRPMARCLLLVCATLLILHSLEGHAHADLLAAVPVADHVPGDDHHDAAGGSCEMARTPTVDVDCAVGDLVLPFIAPLVAPSALGGTAVAAGETSHRPPLFLLHAALLI